MSYGREIFGRILLISSGDAPELCDPAEKTLTRFALAVEQDEKAKRWLRLEYR